MFYYFVCVSMHYLFLRNLFTLCTKSSNSPPLVLSSDGLDVNLGLVILTSCYYACALVSLLKEILTVLK